MKWTVIGKIPFADDANLLYRVGDKLRQLSYYKENKDKLKELEIRGKEEQRNQSAIFYSKMR